MTPERLRQLEALLEQFSDVSEAERESRLAAIDDVGLREELRGLFDSGTQVSSIADAIAGVAYIATGVDGMPGHFGPWRITGTLGFGGMGAVYRAVRADAAYTKEVAIKVQHTGLTDPAVHDRFRQERQILADLEHPNIARMLDGGDTADGHSYIVMECVHGEDIVSYCNRHKLSREERLRLFLPVCAAVEAAHRNLVIHRDLKPANILVTETGTPKLLDFGIAKWLEHQTPATQMGLQPLTPQYASPEQIRGGEIGPATDIYSLGAVLYEMLTGSRAQQSTAAAGPTAEVRPPGKIVPGFDRALEAVLLKALELEPGRRYRSAEEFAADIARFLEGAPVHARPLTPLALVIKQVRRRLPVIAGAACLIAAVPIAEMYGVFRSAPPPSPPKRLTALDGNQQKPAFSPDGSQLVFSWEGEDLANRDLYITALAGGPLRRITTNPASDDFPAWSPDGRSIAFVRSESSVMLVDPLGVSERKIAETNGRFLAWTPDSRDVLFVKSDADKKTQSLWQVEVASGEQRRLTIPEENVDSEEPALISPDGKYLGYARRAGPTASPELYVRLLAGGTIRQLTHDGVSIMGWGWMPDSREILMASRRSKISHTLWRIGVSGWRREPIPIPETPHAAYPAVGRTGGASREGAPLIAYEQWSRHAGLLETALRAGKSAPVLDTQALHSIVPSTGMDSSPRISPDGKWLAFTSDRGGVFEIWRSDSGGRNPMVLTSLGANDFSVGSPQWSPDSRQLVFDVHDRNHRNIYLMSAQGGAPRRVTAWPSSDQFRPSWSADGRWIYFGSNLHGVGLWKLPATASDASLDQAVAVANGAFEGFESEDGSTLYYFRKGAGSQGELVAQPVAGGPAATLKGIVTYNGWWVLRKKGIYFLNMAAPPVVPKPDTRWPVGFFSFDKQQVSIIGELEGQLNLNTPDFWVSPDEQRLLYGRMGFSNTNIMLLDRLR